MWLTTQNSPLNDCGQTGHAGSSTGGSGRKVSASKNSNNNNNYKNSNNNNYNNNINTKGKSFLFLDLSSNPFNPSAMNLSQQGQTQTQSQSQLQGQTQVGKEGPNETVSKASVFNSGPCPVPYMNPTISPQQLFNMPQVQATISPLDFWVNRRCKTNKTVYDQVGSDRTDGQCHKYESIWLRK